MILILFILTAISLLLFYNIDYKYYKKHGEWDEHGLYGPFIVVHNHPSGQVTPSPNDIALTRRLQACGELLGIALLDHIIVGGHTYLSMREEKILIR